MRVVDIENWNRKDHYNYFKGHDYPHFSICGNLDITTFNRYIKGKGYPFFISLLFTVVKTANNIKEFKYRIREDKLVEHDKVSSSFTLMTPKEVFSFCTVEFIDNFNEFFINTSKIMEETKNLVCIEDEPGRDDLLYITSIPWVSFTNITHPIHMHPVDSIPRISWGKYFEENGKIKLPFSIQAHHALVDGIQIGQFFNQIQEVLDNPEKFL
jgi:chloramphenicol O-acetyltransferase type A